MDHDGLRLMCGIPNLTARGPFAIEKLRTGSILRAVEKAQDLPNNDK
jgi:hypothetical protein